MFDSNFDTFVFSEMELDAEEERRREKEESSYDQCPHEDGDTGITGEEDY